MVCLKAVFAGGCLGVPLRVGLSAASPRYAVGFPLQSLTWVKGISLSCACTLAHGLAHLEQHGRRPRAVAPLSDCGRILLGLHHAPHPQRAPCRAERREVAFGRRCGRCRDGVRQIGRNCQIENKERGQEERDMSADWTAR